MKKCPRRVLFSVVFVMFAVFLACPALAAARLTVFAAASMTESMNQIAEMYRKAAPDVGIVLNFDSSGTLKTQIEHGADCDIFISAGQRQMDDIGEKFAMPGTRFDIVSNKVVMIVPKGRNPKRIGDFRDVVTDKVSLLALGNADVPVGQYSEEIYTNLGIWEELKNQKKTSYAGNVKEVLSQVAAGAVDCGIVYGTDAATNADVEVAASAPAGSHKPIAYPAAVMKKTGDAEAAKIFVDFLKGPEATEVFMSVGFAVPGK